MTSFIWPGDLIASLKQSVIDAVSIVCGGFRVNSAGSASLTGDATTWDDLRELLNGDNLYSAPGKADYDWGNIDTTGLSLSFMVQIKLTGPGLAPGPSL